MEEQHVFKSVANLEYDHGFFRYNLYNGNSHMKNDVIGKELGINCKLFFYIKNVAMITLKYILINVMEDENVNT